MSLVQLLHLPEVKTIKCNMKAGLGFHTITSDFRHNNAMAKLVDGNEFQLHSYVLAPTRSETNKFMYDR